MSISVIIPTLNASATLPALLHTLTDGAVDGIIREVIIADGGSSDTTLQIAENFGATLCLSDPGRGQQMSAGARLARSDWLMFIHADTIPGGDWISEVRRFTHVEPSKERNRIGVFQLHFDEKGLGPSIVAWGAKVRTQYFQLPYGDQGLLIAKSHYDSVGGYSQISLFEDVDIIDRLMQQATKRDLHIFNSPAVTSAKRYREEGYTKRVVRNFICICMYRCGVSMSRIQTFYEGSHE